MKTMRKIVIKVGTSTLTQGTTKLSRSYMLALVQQIVQLKAKGCQIVIISSGAVAAGKELLQAHDKSERPSKQVAASLGQVRLMQVWSDLFALFDFPVGQMLLTKHDFVLTSQQTEQTLNCLLQHAIIPIVNENDCVAFMEARIGDNDTLAALVAEAISADTVILLTDQEGLYTADPRHDSSAELISVVSHIDETVFALAGDSGSVLGTGGMMTKINAAKIASQSGIRTIIASSARPNVLLDLAEGKQLGTHFLAQV